MKRFSASVFSLAVLLGMASPQASADVIVSAIFTPPPSVPTGVGTGTLTLPGGSVVAIGYTTTSFLNSGAALNQPWGTTLGTNGIVDLTPIPAAPLANGGVLGSTGALQTTTITFGAAVVNPYLLINFADATSTMDFGTASFNIISKFHSAFAGDVVTFAGATNAVDDGFAIQLVGTYGPTKSLSFIYGDTATNGGGATVGFTVGVAAVPEPGQLALASCIGVFVYASSWLRRRRTV